ncbi:MAG: alpha-E domain-containing protein [Eubacteriales bacterium]|nr:alpha-E domain-containing protein [Eubacteriales bacterium]
MGTISLEKMNHLFWLGRYAERVYTTLRMFDWYYDVMIDKNPMEYQEYCRRLAIPDIYTDVENFTQSYLFDGNNADSMYANLMRAFDNAVVIREEVSSEVLSYIQMSLDALKLSAGCAAPVLELQKVTDYLLAFWGCADDYVENEESRNVLKCGKYLERLDLYFRFDYPTAMLEKEYSKLKNRMCRVKLVCYDEKLEEFIQIVRNPEARKKKYTEALELLGEAVEV